jgi:hypothetical protein
MRRSHPCIREYTGDGISETSERYTTDPNLYPKQLIILHLYSYRDIYSSFHEILPVELFLGLQQQKIELDQLY